MALGWCTRGQPGLDGVRPGNRCKGGRIGNGDLPNDLGSVIDSAAGNHLHKNVNRIRRGELTGRAPSHLVGVSGLRSAARSDAFGVHNCKYSCNPVIFA